MAIEETEIKDIKKSNKWKGFFPSLKLNLKVVCTESTLNMILEYFVNDVTSGKSVTCRF